MKEILVVIFCTVALSAVTIGIAGADTAFQDAFVPAGGSGGMASDNGQIELAVAPSTYTGPMNIRYTPNTMNSVPQPPAGTIWVGSPFNLQIYDTDLGKLIATDQPMTLSVHYNPSDLGGRLESSLRIVRLYDTWSNLPSTVDTTRHVVTTQILFSGDYGLVASDVSVPAPAPVAAPAPTSPPAPPPPPPAPAPPAAPTLPPPPAPESSSVISGKVFFDKNGNGVMDNDDFPVAGAGVIIVSGNWHSFVRTGADGSYSFAGLAGAGYTVNVVVGPEWAYTTPVSVGITVTGQRDSTGTASFGLWYR
ncbi:MAG TPA: SdrD B-like domain-containing protein [Chloroflexota bacterium]